MGHLYDVTMGGRPCQVLSLSVYDVAVFAVKTDPDIKPFKFATSFPGLLGKVYSCGWHFGYEQTFSMGYVSKLYDEAIIHTTPMNQGCSGGPTLDASFNIIGVNSAILTGYNGWNGVSYSVKGDILQGVYKDALQVIKQKEDLQKFLDRRRKSA